MELRAGQALFLVGNHRQLDLRRDERGGLPHNACVIGPEAMVPAVQRDQRANVRVLDDQGSHNRSPVRP